RRRRSRPALIFGSTSFSKAGCRKASCLLVSIMLKQATHLNQPQFETVLSRDRFKGLKAILDSISSDRQAQCEAVNSATSYEDLLKRLGYRLELLKQIHVQDAFSRMGPEGGIRAVLPYYDTPTQSSFPTIVSFNSTVGATSKSAAFFEQLLAV